MDKHDKAYNAGPPARWFVTGLLVAAVVATLILAASFLAHVTPAFAFTPGQDGHPTSLHQTDLKGREADVSLTFDPEPRYACYMEFFARSSHALILGSIAAWSATD